MEAQEFANKRLTCSLALSPPPSASQTDISCLAKAIWIPSSKNPCEMANLFPRALDTYFTGAGFVSLWSRTHQFWECLPAHPPAHCKLPRSRGPWFNHIHAVSCLLWGVLSAHWVVHIPVKSRLVATPREANILKHCNQIPRARCFA